jgi:mRNA-degrading endonuclease YafQ of YafQ-DinJ toxin-antitoxin module
VKFHPKFKSFLKRIKDKNAQDAIESKLLKLKESPRHFSDSLTGPLAGDREISVLQDLRIIVTLCWDCHGSTHQQKHKCPCDEIPKNTIVVWWVGNHKEMRHAQGITSMPWPDNDKLCP